MESYKKAGVDVEKGDLFVERLKKMVGETYKGHEERVLSGIGGFASLYKVGDRYLAAGTDGVGTKVKISQFLGQHDTLGIDLVAMCVNDIICTGAKPLFFMDYLATGKLHLEVSEQLVKGVVEGCREAGMVLIGGETAEMPDCYPDGEYDLAGFAVGEVYPKELIDETSVKEGDKLIGLTSSGVHSNGFSLLRKLIKEEETELWQKALKPTQIYAGLIQKLRGELSPGAIRGMAHITGGGLNNIARMNSRLDYEIENLPNPGDVSELFPLMEERSGASKEELYKTFNMGLGFVLATPKEEEQNILDFFKNQPDGPKAFSLGQTISGQGNVLVDTNNEKFKLRKD